MKARSNEQIYNHRYKALNMGVACGPGYPLQVLALPAPQPSTQAVGFSLLSLTRETGLSKSEIKHSISEI
ncbi:MAG: hypothetical protein JWO58_3335 [Chitinophagaceae bacterium]|nr:hypothetical protein [Chitinophagaceae bacterium]